MSTHPAQPSHNPFPGLRPFRARENALFFGREGQTDELLRRLRTQRFLAVVGTSGSGKSSLVRAGLIPALHAGRMIGHGTAWRVIVLRPGDSPLARLARGLELAFGRRDRERDMRVGLFETTLRRSEGGLVEAVRQARPAEHINVLVLVDQFEEVFRFKSARPRSDDEATAFVRLLLRACGTADARIFVCLTMRSDFLGDCSQFNGLPESINTAQYLVPRMTRRQRVQAVTGPAAVQGTRLSRRLTLRLINEAGDDPDHLPTLQHALMRTFEHWYKRTGGAGEIQFEDYEAVGGMQRALELHAEEVFAQLITHLGPDAENTTETVFRCLTESTPDGRRVRRPATLAEIAAVTGAPPESVRAILDAFRHPGCAFLMPPAGARLDQSSVIDISHETLMRVWRRLRLWVDRETESARLYRRLLETARLHAQGEAALYHGPDLEVALNWRAHEVPRAVWAARYGGDFTLAMQFLDESQAASVQSSAEAQAREQALSEARALGEQSLVLRNVLSTIPHYIFWKDSDLVYQGCNGSFARAAGLADVAHIVGKTDLDLWPPDEAEKYRADDRRVMTLGTPVTLEEQQTQADGQVIWAVTNKVPLRDAENRVIGILGTYMDITHIKRLEQKLQAAEDALRRTLPAP